MQALFSNQKTNVAMKAINREKLQNEVWKRQINFCLLTFNFVDGGGVGNRTRIQKPTPQESTRLSVSPLP